MRGAWNSAAGRTAQDYNRRKACLGAIWEDRYHATAIETDAHQHRCLVYIDLNLVRAGVEPHPTQWEHGGYRNIQEPPDRYRLIDLAAPSMLCGSGNIADFKVGHCRWMVRGQLSELFCTSQATGCRLIGSMIGTRQRSHRVAISTLKHPLLARLTRRAVPIIGCI